MSIPVLVDPTFTEEQTTSVSASAFGIERIRFSSAGVIPFETIAEKPPRKFTPTFFAALSSVLAIWTKSSGVLQALAPIRPIGVTEIRLWTIGIPYSLEISSPVFTSFAALDVILL